MQENELAKSEKFKGHTKKKSYFLKDIINNIYLKLNYHKSNKIFYILEHHITCKRKE